LKSHDQQEFKNTLLQVEVFLDSLGVELNFMMNGNQNLSREILYQRLQNCIDNLSTSLNIESITQSKLGNKLSAIYHQLIRINDTSSQLVKI
jgi:flagellin-specific chaperone FliS